MIQDTVISIEEDLTEIIDISADSYEDIQNLNSKIEMDNAFTHQ